MDKEKKKDILIRVCCIIAALVLWVFIRGSEDPVESRIIRSVPVKILGTEELSDSKLTLVPDQEFYVNISIKGPSTVIYNIDKDREISIEADISKYALKVGENKIPVEIKEVPNQVQVLNADSLVVQVNLDQQQSKDMEVTTKFIGVALENMHFEDATTNPTTVKITGGSTTISKVSSLITEIDLTNIQGDFNKSLEVKAVDKNGNLVKNVTINPRYVQVKMKGLVGKNVKVQPNITGQFKDGISMESAVPNPSTVNIVGKEDVINKIDSISTEAINAAFITDDTNVSVKVILPEGVALADATKNTVNVAVKVAESKELKLSIPITLINVPNGKEGTISTVTLDLILIGGKDKIDIINSSTIKAVADASGLEDGTHDVVVTLNGVPSNVTISYRSLDKVKVTIKSNSEG